MSKSIAHKVFGRLAALAGALGSFAVLATASLLMLVSFTGTGNANGTTVEPPKPDKLIVRTWGGPWRTTYSEGPAASFTKKTGIPVEFDGTDFNEIQVKIQQSVSAGQRPPVDVVGSIESNSFAAQVQGISAPLDLHLLTNLNELSSFAMPEGAKNYINVSTYSQPLIYDPKQVTLSDNVSWEEIFDSKYAGKLFLTDTPESLLLPVAKMMGLDVASDDLTPAFNKIAELKNNISAIGDEEEFIAGIEAGEVSIGITLVATALEIGGLKWVVPKEGAVVSAESYYIAKGLPDNVTYWSQVFINEILSVPNQEMIAENIGEVPVNLKASVPDFMNGDPAFPFTDEDFANYGIVVPVELAARNKSKWQAAYTAAIQQ